MQWKTTKHDDGNATHTGTSDWYSNADRAYVIEEKLADDGIWEYTLDLWFGDDYVNQPFSYGGELCPPFAELGDAMKAAEGLEVLNVVRSSEFDGYEVAEHELS
jgi:hypothetical protein